MSYLTLQMGRNVVNQLPSDVAPNLRILESLIICHKEFRTLVCYKYEGRTESHEQLFFACELGTEDEGE